MAQVTQSNDGKKAMPEDELPAGDEGVEESKEAEERESPEPLPYRAPQPKAKAAAPGFFTIYKKGQGYWTRMGTAIGAAGLGFMISYLIYDKLPTFVPQTSVHQQQIAHRISLTVALVFLAAYSFWAFRFTNKPSNVDFLIATDSEMKKVNWTTRKELIGSTKVVIWFMLIIALFLFACDLLFGAFFHLIGVLRTWF